jgi:hypothetical protein
LTKRSLEEKFCELRLYGILGSTHSPGPTPVLVSALSRRNYRMADL